MLLRAIADAFGLAPRLSAALARRPSLIDAALDPRFSQALSTDKAGQRVETLRQRMDGANFEGALNIARRFHAEEALRVGLQVLQGRASAAEAGHAHADLAQACVSALAEQALAETTRRFGPPPGAFVVLALGKFGGMEMAEGSDLDIMLVYEGEAASDGLSATEYYTRLTQRLISALTAPTEEGLLYEVDMQLRPSGSKGPVAVRLSSFTSYYATEAWTWELQALTRVRPVAGDADLARRTMDAARAALVMPRAPAKLREDVVAMRARMDKERPGRGLWDLKLAPGGLVDIEFIAQAKILTAAAEGRDLIAANTGAALGRLAQDGALGQGDSDALLSAWRLYSDLTQVLRICVDEPFDPETASNRLKQLLAQTAGESDFPRLVSRLADVQADIRARFVRLLAA
jgi:glutamate-ammonia-ligase adenylyltransferase